MLFTQMNNGSLIRPAIVVPKQDGRKKCKTNDKLDKIIFRGGSSWM